MKIPALVSNQAELTVAEVKRYSRHILLPQMGLEGQKRIKNASVLVIGAGGLGSPVLMYLAAAGVGTIGICEYDNVDETNLQRQIIHSTKNIGLSKTQSAAQRMKEINPLIKINTHEFMLNSSNALDLFKDYDVIVDGTDNFATRYLINDACVLLNKAYVWGSIYQFDAQVSVFWNKYGPCYRCLHPNPPPLNMVQNCASGGVLGSICASIGSIQVTQTLQLITGIGEVLIGEVLSYAALETNFCKIKINKDPNCVLCGTNEITSLIDYDQFCGPVKPRKAPGIKAVELAKLLNSREQKETDFLLVDIREPGETSIVSIAGSVAIHMDDIFAEQGLSLLPKDKPVIVFCRSGSRSTQVLEYLQQNGYIDSQHLEGGVLAWVEQVESDKASY
jgi:adenylyltransferase/sulfurtransferase